MKENKLVIFFVKHWQMWPYQNYAFYILANYTFIFYDTSQAFYNKQRLQEVTSSSLLYLNYFYIYFNFPLQHHVLVSLNGLPFGDIFLLINLLNHSFIYVYCFIVFSLKLQSEAYVHRNFMSFIQVLCPSSHNAVCDM
jgi:predicted ATPase